MSPSRTLSEDEQETLDSLRPVVETFLYQRLSAAPKPYASGEELWCHFKEAFLDLMVADDDKPVAPATVEDKPVVVEKPVVVVQEVAKKQAVKAPVETTSVSVKKPAVKAPRPEPVAPPVVATVAPVATAQPTVPVVAPVVAAPAKKVAVKAPSSTSQTVVAPTVAPAEPETSNKRKLKDASEGGEQAKKKRQTCSFEGCGKNIVNEDKVIDGKLYCAGHYETLSKKRTRENLLANVAVAPTAEEARLLKLSESTNKPSTVKVDTSKTSIDKKYVISPKAQAIVDRINNDKPKIIFKPADEPAPVAPTSTVKEDTEDVKLCKRFGLKFYEDGTINFTESTKPVSIMDDDNEEFWKLDEAVYDGRCGLLHRYTNAFLSAAPTSCGLYELFGRVEDGKLVPLKDLDDGFISWVSGCNIYMSEVLTLDQDFYV